MKGSGVGYSQNGAEAEAGCGWIDLGRWSWEWPVGMTFQRDPHQGNDNKTLHLKSFPFEAREP